MVNIHPGIHNRPKSLRHHPTKNYIAGSANKNSLNDESLALGALNSAKEACTWPLKVCWAEKGLKTSSWDSPRGPGMHLQKRIFCEETSHKLYEKEKGKFKQCQTYFSKYGL